MSALALKSRLAAAGVSQGELATALGISRPAVVSLLNHSRWPASRDRRALRSAITEFLQQHGIPHTDAFRQKKAPKRSNASRPDVPPTLNSKGDTEMLLRKHTLTPAARQHFGLQQSPFEDVTDTSEVFISPEIRQVRDVMHYVARFGGFLAVVGESGAGKSTLREELIDRLQREDRNVIVIEPSVLAMEDRESQGKTLKSQHIAEAIMATVAPLAAPKSSPEARFRQLKQVLVESSHAGMKHVLIIEEAHALPVPTLKHLKRFIEMKDGLKKLLGVILLGQPELRQKLAEQDPQVREVVQRIEIVTLAPLDGDLDAYLKQRFERAGVPVARVLEQSAIDAIRTKLAPSRKGAMSLTYPLVVHNVLACAMNIAADICAPRVTADCVREV